MTAKIEYNIVIQLGGLNAYVKIEMNYLIRIDLLRFMISIEQIEKLKNKIEITDWYMGMECGKKLV